MFNHRGRTQISTNSAKSVTKYLRSLISTQSSPDRQFVNFLEPYKCRYLKIYTQIFQNQTQRIFLTSYYWKIGTICRTN